MSSRHVRKVYGGNELPPPVEVDSDDDFGPTYAKRSSLKSAFEGVSNLIYLKYWL